MYFIMLKKKKVLVDSTCLLPIVGVEVEGILGNPLSVLLLKGYKPVVNRVSFFEVVGKALREAEHAPKREEILARIQSGVETILWDERIRKVPLCDLRTISLTFGLYKNGLNDLPDCLITASAYIYSDFLLTESRDIKPACEKAGIEPKIVRWKDLFKRAI